MKPGAVPNCSKMFYTHGIILHGRGGVSRLSDSVHSHLCIRAERSARQAFSFVDDTCSLSTFDEEAVRVDDEAVAEGV